MDKLGVQLVIMAVFGAICSMLAHGKGRSAIGWFFIGFLAPILGLILVLVLPNVEQQRKRYRKFERDNHRLREQVRKERMVSNQRHRVTAQRLRAHDRVLNVETEPVAEDDESLLEYEEEPPVPQRQAPIAARSTRSRPRNG